MTTSVRTMVKNALFDRVPGLLRRGPLASKRVALTFDDGPGDLTLRYLELLDDYGIPATFFVSGNRAAAHPDLVREYIRRGHQVANHGFDHTVFSKLSRKELLDQIERTEQAIGRQVTGRPWVRPPHGVIDPMSLLTLRTAGCLVALWSIDSGDYEEKDPARLADRCSPALVSGGDVLLFHEGQKWTLDALPRIISALLASGLEPVTMHDLFAR